MVVAPNKITELVLNTVTVLHGASSAYSTVSNDRCPPDTFYEAGRGLLLVQKALETAVSQLQMQDVAGDSEIATDALNACSLKANLAKNMFEQITRAHETDRLKTYIDIVRREGREILVEALVKGMMKDTCAFAKESAIKAAMSTQVVMLHDAINTLSEMEPSVPNQPGNTFTNYGTGEMFNNTGGTQNNLTGSGKQFPGATFQGTVNFH